MTKARLRCLNPQTADSQHLIDGVSAVGFRLPDGLLATREIFAGRPKLCQNTRKKLGVSRGS